MELHGKAAVTHDFLSLHKEPLLQNSRPPRHGVEQRDGGGAGRAAAIDLNVVAAAAAAAVGPSASSSEHRLASGFGRAVVKPEWSSSTCGPTSPGGAAAAQEEKTVGIGGGTGQSRNSHSPARVFKPWREVDVTRGGSHLQQWPSPLQPPSQQQRDTRDMMDTSSRHKGFADDDEEDEEDFLKETSSRKGLTTKVDGSSNSGDGINDDRKPSTPRSKHSATEQRRRSKINERFQILRNLVPLTDQKRDKASFLLEVIEYIQVLQEKVQKYESPYPGWNLDNVKLMPWYPPTAGGPSSGFFHTQPRMENSGQGQAQWPRSSSSTADGHAGGAADVFNGRDDLVIDEGTINLSSAYSDGLVSALTLALQGSGVDLSQASISVRINLGRQAVGRQASSSKQPGGGGHSRVASSGEDSEQQRPSKKNRRRPAAS
ncbi:unnamed protein product [Spirodela intermedia]|uniref:BHLH domain-containing protein n=1 Tax=Spirodela intermedia TaxID=51605 RepID=A0A7I8IX00_SPIIN|nr:unnamed protein product [Spirodela intermedia]CAA6661510.1 unnamed protein product [Spirodela intermedia]